MSYLDLKETGPLVVAAPPNVIGMFTDFFQRTADRRRRHRPRPGARRALPAPAARLRRRGAGGLLHLPLADLQRLPVLPHDHDPGRRRPRPVAGGGERRAHPHLPGLHPGAGREADELPGRLRPAHRHDVPGRQHLLDQAQGLRRLRARGRARPRSPRHPRADRHREGQALRADRGAAGAAEEGRRDGSAHDHGAAPARPPRRAQPLLRRPAVGERLGRRLLRVAAGRLPRRDAARHLLPGRLFLRSGNGDAHP
jgi:hypothetical protein